MRRRRDLMIGVAIGLGIHFFRDLSEPNSGVALLWPWSNHSFSLPHASCVAVAAALVVVDAGRRWAQRRTGLRPAATARASGREPAFAAHEPSAAHR